LIDPIIFMLLPLRRPNRNRT